MIDTAEETTCKACGKPLVQIEGRGHRKKLYCDDRCRQRGHRQSASNVSPNVTNGDLQQRIADLERQVEVQVHNFESGEQYAAELERDLAAAHHLIDEYINRKRTPAEWKKTLQERFWQLGRGADWPALSIHVPLEAGERAYRVFGLAASNELLEWASVALRNRD